MPLMPAAGITLLICAFHRWIYYSFSPQIIHLVSILSRWIHLPIWQHRSRGIYGIVWLFDEILNDFREMFSICCMRCNRNHMTALHHWCITGAYDDVMKWKHFPRYWPFVRGIQRSPVNSPHKGQWRGALMFSLICAWINGCVNNREAVDLRRHRTHYDVTVMAEPLSKYLISNTPYYSFASIVLTSKNKMIHSISH